MLPDRVSNPGSLTYESGALPIALRGPARSRGMIKIKSCNFSNLFTFVKISAVRSKVSFRQ